MNIHKEMWQAAQLIEKLKEGGRYPGVEGIVYGLKDQLSQLDFFYNNLVPKQGGDASKTFYRLRNPINEHQLVYINLNRGYPKETFDGHYCYVVKNFNDSLIVIPVTSVKPKTYLNEEYEMEIESTDGTSCILQIANIRSVDVMRVVQEKTYKELKTDKNTIMEKIISVIFKKVLTNKFKCGIM